MKTFLIVLLLFVSKISYSQKGGASFLKENTTIKDPLKLRDPFKAPRSAFEAKKKESTQVKKGVFTNIGNPNSLTLDSLKVLGVLLGERKRAIVTSDQKSTPTYMISEGKKIANGTVELKAILPGGVIFVEKITNVYGQTEYLETVIPISK